MTNATDAEGLLVNGASEPDSRPDADARPEAGARPAADVVDHLTRALTTLGVVGADPETVRTPGRVAELYQTLFSGLDEAAAPVLGPTEHTGREMVLVKDVPFYSMCAHHLLPFFGHASVAYLPAGRVVGLGAIAHTVSYYAARPQIQERLAEQIADHLDRGLQARGVIVHLRARHMCVEMRGPKKPAHVECVASRGALTDGVEREAFLRRLTN